MLTTAEVADYLRLKERTIYEMVARGQIPCSRATGKLLFSRALVDAWVEAHTEVPDGGRPATSPIYAGSSEPLLEWALRQSGSGLATLVGGSRIGLEALARGEALLAGVHLIDPATGVYNTPQIRALVPRADVVAIHWARRSQGLMVAPGNPHGVAGLADALSRGLRLARRRAGSGSRLLLDTLAAREGLAAAADAGREADSQGDVASLIAMGEADCGLGVAAAAAGLDFIPLATEEFDLVMRRRDYFEPPVQALLAFARTDDFARRVAFLGGYDIADLGAVRYNA